MKKVVRILLAILMVAALALGITACKSECQKGNHDFTGEENVVTSATCERDGIKTVKCVNCDQTKEVTIPKLGHDYTGANWSPCEDDDEHHQRVCVRSGCGYVDKAVHVYVDGECVCGKTEGTNPQPCTHPNKTSTETPATCMAAKVIHWTCPDCSWTDDETVGEPLGHDYTGAEWHANGNTHYQVCNRDGCDEHNSHVADMSTTWTSCADDETQHQKTCSHEGCGIVEKAPHGSVTVPGTPATCTEDGRRNGTKCPDCNKVLEEGAVIPKKGHNFATDWTHDLENGKHYHACLNEGCTARDSETECDYVYGAAQTNATQHWGVCSVCGNQSKPENHNSNTVLPAEEAKCYKDGKTEGKACSVCNHIMQAQETISKKTVKHSWVWVYGDDRDDSHKDVDHYQKCSVAECGAITNAGAHALHMTQGDDNQHWEACQCGYVDESSKENHTWAGEDGFACPTCGKVAPGVYLAVAIEGETTVHRLGETGTLQQAVNLVGEGKTATIYLGHDLSGSGVIVPSGRNITFRFNNHTYTVTDNLVGSSGTETNGFQLLKGSNITFINANIVAQNASMYILVQNYANLTLDHVNLDAGNSSVTYVLSNNNGNILIKNDTKITAPANKYAFDVYYNLNGNYADGVSVTVESGCLITGAIGYGGEHLTEGWQSKTLISLPNADKNYNIKLQQGLGLTCESVGITIAGNRLDHKEGAGVVTVPATCHSKGETSYCCTVCGKVLRTEKIEITAEHNWNEGVVTTEPTCTVDGVKTFTCTNDGCGATKTETIHLGHDWQQIWSYENNGDTHSHWHACNRCSERKDADTCTGVLVTEAKAPTCEGTGNNAGYQCSVCKNTWGGETIPATGHHYSETLTAINATQHGYKCADCDKYDGIANHTYTANHCDACGRDITQEEIISLFANLAKNDYLLNERNTYTLTGIYGGLIKNLNYALNDEQGNQIIACFDRTLDPSQDLIIGDKISVTGKIKNYSGTIEFDGFTYELVQRGSSEVTAKVEVAEGTLPEGITVDFAPALVGDKAENMSTVKFVVNGLPEGWIVAGVTGIEYTFDPETNEYSFTVKGDTSIVVEVKLDDGKRTYEVDVTYNASEHLDDDVKNITVDYAITMSVTNGAMNSAGQLRVYASAQLTVKTSIGTITKIVFTTTSGSNSGANLSVKVGTFTGSGTVFEWNGDASEIDFASSSQTRIINMVITYTKTVECKHEHAQTIGEAKGATCTEMGFKSAGIYCPDCGHFTTDGWATLADGEIVAAKGHVYKPVEATAGDCQHKSVAAHYICENGCGKVFVDENGEKKETTLEELQGDFGAHSYGAWSHVEGTETHSRACTIDGCNEVETVACASATWHTSATEHWQICDVCDTEFGRESHTGDTCECGAIELTYTVTDASGVVIENAVDTVELPAYAVSGTEIEVTVTATANYAITAVKNGEAELVAQGNNVYKGTITSGAITVVVKSLDSTLYLGVEYNIIDIVLAEVKRNDETAELADNVALAEGDVLKIAVDVYEEGYDVAVSVRQGSNEKPVTLTASETGYTGEYTYTGKGDVTVIVTLTKRATITINADNATVTVTQNGASVIGKTVSVGSTVNIIIAANDEGYVVESKVITGAEGPADNADGEYTVTGDMTITVTVVKLVTVNIPTIDGATVTVKTESNQDVADGTAVPAGTKLIISVNVTDETKQVASVKIGEETLTANTDGNYEGIISRDWSANEITVNVELGKKVNKSWKLVTSDTAVSSLVGKQVIIAAKSANYAISTTQSGNNRPQVEFNKVDPITPSTDVQIFTLVAGTKADTYAFATENGYIYAASSSSNYMRTESQLSDNSSWSITFDSAGTATIKAQGTYTRNWLRYNSSSKIFSCYSSGQGEVSIYVFD